MTSAALPRCNRATSITLVIFICINQFAYNWIAAVVAHFSGHLVTSIMLLDGYVGKFDLGTVMVHIVNFNMGLIVAAALYYTFEKQSRCINFLSWKIEKVCAVKMLICRSWRPGRRWLTCYQSACW